MSKDLRSNEKTLTIGKNATFEQVIDRIYHVADILHFIAVDICSGQRIRGESVFVQVIQQIDHITDIDYRIPMDVTRTKFRSIVRFSELRVVMINSIEALTAKSIGKRTAGRLYTGKT